MGLTSLVEVGRFGGFQDVEYLIDLATPYVELHPLLREGYHAAVLGDIECVHAAWVSVVIAETQINQEYGGSESIGADLMSRDFLEDLTLLAYYNFMQQIIFCDGDINDLCVYTPSNELHGIVRPVCGQKYFESYILKNELKIFDLWSKSVDVFCQDKRDIENLKESARSAYRLLKKNYR